MQQLTGVTLLPFESSFLFVTITVQQCALHSDVMDSKDKVSPRFSSTSIICPILLLPGRTMTLWRSYAVDYRHGCIWNNSSASHNILQNHIGWNGDESSELIPHASLPRIYATVNTTPPPPIKHNRRGAEWRYRTLFQLCMSQKLRLPQALF